ncbi:hypothetical protein LguiA_013249 [Lonicera macranthoides]
MGRLDQPSCLGTDLVLFKSSLLLFHPICERYTTVRLERAAAFPQGYGLSVIDHTAPPISPSYQIQFMNRSSFPTGFVFGAASSAYQIEGAWNKDGKGESGKLSDGVSEAGIKYYLNIIKYLKRKGLEPSVTLFHWDIPQGLEKEYGGFLSAKVVDDYLNYVDVCFKRFGHLVKSWITFNEPWSYSVSGYDNGLFAPGHCSSWIDSTCTGGNSSTEPYLVSHYQLLAHSAAVKLYRKKYQAFQKGKIGITLVSTWMVPQNSSSSGDRLAAGRALDFMLGWFMDPVVYGKYPSSMEKLVGERLPKFTKKESRELKGSFDFIGMNYYTAYYVIDSLNTTYEHARYNTDSHATLTYFDSLGNPIGAKAGSDWLHVYPTGLWKLLRFIKKKYNNPTLYITENGVDEINNSTLPLELALKDNFRVTYYYLHLAHVLKAVNNGSNIEGYYAWSILDNFEWASGYNVRFGIYYIDFDNGFKRYSKLSAKWFSQFLKH